MKTRIAKFLNRNKKRARRIKPEEEQKIRDQISENLKITIKKQQERIKHHHTPGKF